MYTVQPNISHYSHHCSGLGLIPRYLQDTPEASLEAKRTKLQLSHFGHIVTRQGSLEKTVMLGKQKAAGKEED